MSQSNYKHVTVIGGYIFSLMGLNIETTI